MPERVLGINQNRTNVVQCCVKFSSLCLNDCYEFVRWTDHSPHRNPKTIWNSGKFLREGHIPMKVSSAASANPRPLKLFSVNLSLPLKMDNLERKSPNSLKLSKNLALNEYILHKFGNWPHLSWSLHFFIRNAWKKTWSSLHSQKCKKLSQTPVGQKNRPSSDNRDFQESKIHKKNSYLFCNHSMYSRVFGIFTFPFIFNWIGKKQ